MNLNITVNESGGSGAVDPPANKMVKLLLLGPPESYQTSGPFTPDQAAQFASVAIGRSDVLQATIVEAE